MRLSKKDRLILFNQYEILKNLNPDEKKYYEIKQDIIEQGFVYDYNELDSFLWEETPTSVSEFVYEVLQMYRCIRDSYYNYDEEDKKEFEKLDPKFQGFDGNEESEYYTYACFLLEKLDKYEESYEGGKIETNSHRNMVDEYKAMILRWKEVRSGKYDSLTIGQIKYIVK